MHSPWSAGLVVITCTCFGLRAQAPAAAPIGAEGDRVAVMRSAGLRVDVDGLRGGGADYRVRLDTQGLRFEPALGRACPATQHVALRPQSLRRGTAAGVDLADQTSPRLDANTASYQRTADAVERYEVRAEGLALSWVFDRALPGNGDLVVRYAIDTSFGEPTRSGDGLAFTGPFGGVSISGVTGIDANGHTVAGALQWHAGGLELALPGSFIDTAAYPIVLDPILGAIVNVSVGLTYADGEPDVAYDVSNALWLVVWERAFSATNVDIRGQRVSDVGTLLGSTIFFGSNGVASSPRVANSNRRDRFGVCWTQQVGSTSTVQFEAVEAMTGVSGFPFVVATTTATPFASADICCGTVAISVGNCFGIVYDDDNAAMIRVRGIDFDANGQLLAAGPQNLVPYPLFATLDQPAIARASSEMGLGATAKDAFGLVCKSRGLLSGSSSIEFRVVGPAGGTWGTWSSTALTLDTSGSDNLGRPDVDGFDGRWVATWERLATSGTFDAVRAVALRVDTSGASPVSVASNTTSFGGTLGTRASRPTVGFTQNRSWIGYRRFDFLTSTTTLRASAVDTTSCTQCNDTMTVSFPGGERIVVGTKTSGGFDNDTTSFAVWHDSFDDIAGQRLLHYGASGTFQNLGGSCGTSGTLAWNHAPGIGSPLKCSLTGMPVTPGLAVFNLSPPAIPVSCGTCSWTPFSVTIVAPISLGLAAVEFLVPCHPGLVGAQLEAQWTVVDLLQAPCPLVPGFAVSDRSLMTIGQ